MVSYYLQPTPLQIFLGPSVVGLKAYIFGGELVQKGPTDNQVDVIEVGNESGKGKRIQYDVYVLTVSTEPSVQTIHVQAEAPIPRLYSQHNSRRKHLEFLRSQWP